MGFSRAFPNDRTSLHFPGNSFIHCNLRYIMLSYAGLCCLTLYIASRYRIRSLRTNQPQVEILHSLTPAAGIRVTRDGRKTFFLIYRSPETGKQKRHSFGYHPSGRKGRGRTEEPPVSASSPRKIS
jgi:hypothetical protein